MAMLRILCPEPEYLSIALNASVGQINSCSRGVTESSPEEARPRPTGSSG